MTLPCAVSMDLDRYMRAQDEADRDEARIAERTLDLQGDHQFVLSQIDDGVLADTIDDDALVSLLPLGIRRIATGRKLDFEDALAVVLTHPAGSDAHDAALAMMRGIVERRAKEAAKNYQGEE